MKILLRIKTNSFILNREAWSFRRWIGIRHHEYWSWWWLVIPVWPLWIWYAIRLRCATWFTVVNPGMEDSGFLGESKMAILKTIPAEYQPIACFIPVGYSLQQLEQTLEKEVLEFPLIAKPDMGGRGRRVHKLIDKTQLQRYHEEMKEDYIVQQLVPYDLELGVFYVRMPNKEKGSITSLTMKKFLSVPGNGRHSIRELMQNDYRASLQVERLSRSLDLSKIPKNGEEIVLEPIGNHSRGTTFLDARHLVNEKLEHVFDKIAAQIPGFYYGRFDLRVRSQEDLYEGNTIMILELNGLTSDATHIFDPKSKLLDAYRTQFKQCRVAFEIAKINLRNGAKPTPLIELFTKSMRYFKNE